MSRRNSRWQVRPAAETVLHTRVLTGLASSRLLSFTGPPHECAHQLLEFESNPTKALPLSATPTSLLKYLSVSLL